MAHMDWHYPREGLARSTFRALVEGPVAALSLFGPRRTGKTEFLIRDLGHLAAASFGHRVLYVSFWQMPDPLAALAYACDQALRPRTASERLKGWVAAHPVKARIKEPQGLAEIEIDLSARPAPDPQPMLQRLDSYLAQMADPARPALLLMDEFQELAGHPAGRAVMAALRTGLDQRRDGLRTVFTGSSQTRLNAVFSSRDAPFYRFATPMTLPDFPDDFVDHQLAVFARTYRRRLQRNAALTWFHRFNRNAELFNQWLMVLGMNLALSEAEASQTMAAALHDSFGFARLWRDLTPLQRAIARLVADEEPGLFGTAVLPRLTALTGFGPAVAERQAALRLLVRRDLVDKADGQWRIADPLFQDFVQTRGAGDF